MHNSLKSMYFKRVVFCLIFQNLRMHLNNPQCSIQNRNVHISELDQLVININVYHRIYFQTPLQLIQCSIHRPMKESTKLACEWIYGSLTQWGRVTHICVSKLTTIGSDNGLSPGRRQAIIWTNARILLIRTLGTNFSEIWSKFHTFSFKKTHLKMLSGKWRTFCFGLNVLKS